MKVEEILIIGASAGLTAAWEADKHGVKTTILEDKVVGGISRTVECNGGN